MTLLLRERTSDPPPRPPAPPDVTHAARCFQALTRQQGICNDLRRAVRREHDRTAKRRLRLLLRRAERKERAALVAYRQALREAARVILARYLSERRV